MNCSGGGGGGSRNSSSSAHSSRRGGRSDGNSRDSRRNSQFMVVLPMWSLVLSEIKKINKWNNYKKNGNPIKLPFK